MKIERNAFSKYVLDLLVEQFAHYCEAKFSFFKITTPPSVDFIHAVHVCMTQSEYTPTFHYQSVNKIIVENKKNSVSIVIDIIHTFQMTYNT